MLEIFLIATWVTYLPASGRLVSCLANIWSEREGLSLAKRRVPWEKTERDPSALLQNLTRHDTSLACPLSRELLRKENVVSVHAASWCSLQEYEQPAPYFRP